MIPFIESAKDEILAKIDTLKTTIDRLISSSQGNNPNIALGNLSNKIDALKQDVGTKSSQVTVNKVGQDLNNIASTLTSKIDTVETKVNQTNTTLATKANQNTVDAVANTANQINTALASKASQASVNAIKSRTDIYLDATISSRAPASTALSSSTWTSNLATALSNKFKPRVHKRVTNTAVAFDAIYTVLNVTGAGCLRRLYILSGEKYADIQFEIMILIDGRVLFYLGGDYSTGFLLRSAPDLDFDRERDLIYPSTSKQTLQYKERRSYGNDFSKQAIFVEPIYFNNSLQVRIQHKTDRASTGYYGSYEIDYEVVV